MFEAYARLLASFYDQRGVKLILYFFLELFTNLPATNFKGPAF